MNDTYLHFCFTILHWNNLSFSASKAKKEYGLLELFFRAYFGIEGYQALLNDIFQIEQGKKEVSEEMALADIPEWSSLLVYKEITVMELIERDGEHKRLEIPTSDFKQLIEDWIKFVEINTAAFAKK